MSGDEINIRLAKLLGWTEIRSCWGELQGKPPGGKCPYTIPEFNEDLNAIRDAELSTGARDRAYYLRALEEIVGEDTQCHPNNAQIECIFASAQQRALALIKTLEGSHEEVTPEAKDGTEARHLTAQAHALKEGIQEAGQA